jgi:hypothetical protein
MAFRPTLFAREAKQVARAQNTRPSAYRNLSRNPVAAPLAVFAAVLVIACAYVTYILWPRWPDVPFAPDAPALPIVIGGVTFNIEPGAIREAVQRRPGTQERVDLSYLWPSLEPADTANKPGSAAQAASSERVFLTIQGGGETLPFMERVQTIYPRYLVPEPVAGPPGITLRGFRNDTPYEGEELVFESQAPEHFLARCSLSGPVNAGSCLLERRIGNADITVRFPRDWLKDWKNVVAGIDRLLARLHPSS